LLDRCRDRRDVDHSRNMLMQFMSHASIANRITCSGVAS
jgi:hypothetical protein